MTKLASQIIEEEIVIINPVIPRDFRLAQHGYSQFDCVVPAGLTSKDLENPQLWVNVAPQLKHMDEVRAIAEDHSFVAYLIVLYSHGSDARLKVVSGAELEEAGISEDQGELYKVQLRGRKKFVIYNSTTGETIKENIPTKKQAYNDRDDHVRAMNA